MQAETVDILIGAIASIISFLLGHRRGRKVHRSGDYIQFSAKGKDVEQ